jgi:hypothetical protein
MSRWFAGALVVGLLAPLGAAPDKLAVTITSATHPALASDFATGSEPLSPRPIEPWGVLTSGGRSEEPPTVDLMRVDEPGRGKVLRLVNAVSGGSFGVNLMRRRPPVVYSRLAFDYRADPNLKVNLWARINSEDYEIGFTGPPWENSRGSFLGRLPGVQADGQWHHLEVPLLRLARRVEPWAEGLRLTELFLENRHQGDYLMAGFGGNQAGTSLCLDNFVLERAGGASAKVAWTTADEVAADGFAVVADRVATTVPPTQVTTQDREMTLVDLKDGVHWVHVRAKAKDGAWGPVAHYRLVVNTTPPEAALLEPANGATACPALWRVRLASKGPGVSPKKIAVQINGTAFATDSRGISYEPVDEVLAIDLGKLQLPADDKNPVRPVRYGDGTRLNLTLTAEDENGLALPKPFAASFTLRHGLDKTAPADPQLRLRMPGAETTDDILGNGTFEYGLDEWQPWPTEQVVVERSDRTAAGGKHSVRLVCLRNASAFASFVSRSGFDAARFKAFSFDYKIPPRLRVDFAIQFRDGTWCRVPFCDKDKDGTQLMPGISAIADNEWHHAEVNLYDMLRAKFEKRDDFRVTQMQLTGGPVSGEKRFPGNYAGTEYFIDNFFLVPTLAADARLEWSADDAVGVAGAEVAVAPDLAGLEAAKPRRVAGGGVNLGDLTTGQFYAQVRLFDPAGNLSEPRVMRLVVAGGRPEIASVWPADGQRVAPSTLGVQFRTERSAGLDVGSLKLEVGGRTYGVDHNVLSYDVNSGRLVWDGRKEETPVIWRNGQVVKIRLLDARDQAGSRPKELPAWQFTMDWAADKVGPAVTVRCKSHPAFYHDDFRADPLTWTAASTAPATVQRVADDRPGGGFTLAVSPAKAGAPYAAWRTLDPPCSLVRFTHLAFDYKIPAGVHADLAVRCRSEGGTEVARVLGLTDRETTALRRLKVPGIVADGQWRQAIIPLLNLLNEDKQYAQSPQISGLGFGDSGPGVTAQPGRGFAVANLFLFRPATTPTARLYWEALDETGVAGYSYLVDQQPRTIPEPKAVAPATTDADTQTAVPNLAPGIHWFHIRAVDGVGNWGPTTHFLLFTPEAPKG